ncbi:hypothetical protein ECPA49_5906, partial [Escherichia coli PA49]
GLTRYRTR